MRDSAFGSLLFSRDVTTFNCTCSLKADLSGFRRYLTSSIKHIFFLFTPSPRHVQAIVRLTDEFTIHARIAAGARRTAHG